MTTKSWLRTITTVLAGAAVAAGLVTALPAATAMGAECTLTPTGGTVKRTIGSRSYLVNVPAGLSGAAPLLLSLHGFGSTGA